MLAALDLARQKLSRLASALTEVDAYHGSRNDVGGDLKRLWSNDAKEAFGRLRAALSTIEGEATHDQPAGREEAARRASEHLDGALSALEASCSEIKDAGLLDRWRGAFEAGVAAVRAALTLLGAARTPRRPTTTVEKVGGERYAILCAACGQKAAEVTVEPFPFEHDPPTLVYRGLTFRRALGDDNREAAFAALERGDLEALHELVTRDVVAEGLDCYCPDCGAAYCREHYDLLERWDDGFYDCTWGRCPNGHERIVDD
ncbi:MAG: hypothetical protein Kow0069_16880 [Promethearchaeota archaeon]